MSELLNTESNAVQNPVVEGSGNAVNAAQEPAVGAQEGAEAQGVQESAKQQETPPKAPQTREENAAAKSVRLRLEAEKADAVQKAKDEAAIELAKRFGLNTPDRPIKSYEDFENLGLDFQLQNAEVDPEKYKALRENDPEVIKARKVLEQQEKQSKDLREFASFRAAFKETMGREFDIQQDAKVYSDVKQEADESGKDITDVYARYQNKTLLARLAEMEAKIQAKETNAANAASSPGSVKADGATATADFISYEEVEKHRGDSGWFRKNYDAIIKSRSKWGG